MNILLIGSGGREHALAWSLKKSSLCTQLFIAPGNVGMEKLGTLLPVAADDVAGLVKAAKENEIDFVMVGPEAPLVLGIADELQKASIKVFGPNKIAAQLEGSKGFMKDVCAKAGVPTAKYKRFTNVDDARAYVRAEGAPIVIKTDGLAAGKGVTVAMNMEDALKAVGEAMVAGVFGKAGAELVIEEYMEGEEVSFFALVDGENAVPFACAQDHKRVFDGDKGPNTGGMGAYSPAPVFTPETEARVMQEIILPTAKYMAANGMPYRGVLFAGLMLTKTGPRLIEYNVRFGDPETQAMLPRLKTDLLETLVKICDGKIAEVEVELLPRAALCVVMAANGYPGTYQKNTVIKNLESATVIPDTEIFHAGTGKNAVGEIIATGGRVLGVTGFGPDIKTAQTNAYKAVDTIDWEGGFCRRDIGHRAV